MSRNNFVNISFIFIIGVCIGILTGLSISPVLQVILSSIVALLTTILSVWYGISNPLNDTNNKSLLKYKISFAPIGCLVIGITLGCLLGIFIRTHDLLGKKADEKCMPAIQQT